MMDYWNEFTKSFGETTLTRAKLINKFGIYHIGDLEEQDSGEATDVRAANLQK